jgi:hypothetical protein
VPFAPKRHWTFTLRTLFVVVTVTAWAVWCWPYTVQVFGKHSFAVENEGGVRTIIVPEGYPPHLLDDPNDQFRSIPNPRLIWPVLTLAVFASLKLGWAVAAHRRRFRAIPLS